MTVQDAVTVLAGSAAGSIALIGFGLDSAIENFASVVIVWVARLLPRAET